MKTRLLKLMFAAVGCGLFACSQGDRKSESSAEKTTAALPHADIMMAPSRLAEQADSVALDKVSANAENAPPAPMSSSATVIGVADSGRKFIRTAEVKFRTKNVIKATIAIEDIMASQHGYVCQTNLTSNVTNQTTTKVSDDSSLETTYVQVANTMVLRVPNSKLDTTLRALAPLVDFLDYRTIKANNIGLKMYANQLVQRRKGRQQLRLAGAVRQHARRLSETVDALADISNAEEQADNAMLENLTMDDSVKYSTISLQLYQREEVNRILLCNYKDIKAFEPGFGRRMADALQSGWRGLLNIVVFFAGIWWLVIIAALVVAWYIKRKSNIRPVTVPAP